MADSKYLQRKEKNRKNLSKPKYFAVEVQHL